MDIAGGYIGLGIILAFELFMLFFVGVDDSDSKIVAISHRVRKH